jgi:hypothetical protein
MYRVFAPHAGQPVETSARNGYLQLGGALLLLEQRVDHTPVQLLRTSAP